MCPAPREHRNEPVHNVRRTEVIAYVLDHYPTVVDAGDLLARSLLPRTERLIDSPAGTCAAGNSL